MATECKLKICKSVVLYVEETRKYTRKLKQKSNIVEMKVLRWIKGITLRNIQTSSYMKEQCGTHYINGLIK